MCSPGFIHPIERISSELVAIDSQQKFLGFPIWGMRVRMMKMVAKIKRLALRRTTMNLRVDETPSLHKHHTEVCDGLPTNISRSKYKPTHWT